MTDPSPSPPSSDLNTPPPSQPPSIWQRLRARLSWRRLLIEVAIVVAVVWAIQAYQTRHLIDGVLPRALG